MSRQPEPNDLARKGHKIPKLADVPTTPAQPHTGAAWEPPTPLNPDHAAAPFPVDALPGWLARFVAGLAEDTQTPADLAGMLVLAVVGGAGAKSVRIHGEANWYEPTNIYVAVALAPGNRKSAVHKVVWQPVRDHERDEIMRTAPEIAAATERRGIAEQRYRAALKKQARSASDTVDSQYRIAELREAVDGIIVPPVPRFVADDSTPEKLVGLLAGAGERMIVESAEGGVFDMMAGRYATNGAPNLDVYLKGHAGDPLRVDRVGRAGESLESPALTVGMTPQPDVIRNLADKPGFRGRGLLARMLYSLPASPVGSRRMRPAPLPERVRAEYNRSIRGLYARLQPPEDMTEDAPSIELSAEACERLLAFREVSEPRLAPGADLSAIQDWASKLAGAVLRIAAILHLAEHVDRTDRLQVPVSDATMAGAIAIGEYLLAHARAAFALMGADPVIGAAGHLLAWIRRSESTSFTEKGAFDGTRGRFRKMSDLRAALAVLVEHGYVRQRDVPAREGAGRPPSPVFDVNPAVKPV